MTPLVLIIVLITGLTVAHAIGRKIPHRPSPKEVQHVRHELARDAYSSLFNLNDNPNWKPDITKYKMKEYKKMRERKLSDWVPS